MVDKHISQSADDASIEDEAKNRLAKLSGRVAIANAVDAYGVLKTELEGERWQALAKQGARPQRVLWASTGTKSPELPKTLYVDALIGPHTVNTVPAATLDAFREEGSAKNILGDGGQELVDQSRALLQETHDQGIVLREITDILLEQGCEAFCDAFDQLLDAVAKKRDKLATRA